MKIPNDPINPTWADSTDVGFFTVLFKDKATKAEWMRRRNAAVANHMAEVNARTEEWARRRQLGAYQDGLADARLRVSQGRWTAVQFERWLSQTNKAMVDAGHDWSVLAA